MSEQQSASRGDATTSHGDGAVATNTPGSSSGYKRASRKGAPKTHRCSHPGCDKSYTRAEHLQRHYLNHKPKGLHRCNELHCGQEFVREDLLHRHQERHKSESYVARKRRSDFTPEEKAKKLRLDSAAMLLPQPIPSANPRPSGYPPSLTGQPHDAAILLTPESSTHTVSATQPLANVPPNRAQSWGSALPQLDGHAAINQLRPGPGKSYYGHENVPMVSDGNMMQFNGMHFSPEEAQRENFTMWLFDPQQSNFRDFPMQNIPFLEGGLETTFSNTIRYDDTLTNSSGGLDLSAPMAMEMNEDIITESKRQDVLRHFQVFRQKQPKYEPFIGSLVLESGGDLPALNLDMMRTCLNEYWDHVSPRLPIVHQHTFSCNQSSVCLLMVMIALGASSLRGRDTTGQYNEYDGFADVIISGVRWEILSAADAIPPVALWVVQALLLLEYYEKHFSSREFHERAHVYHNVTLMLLRRGNPLIGRQGSESPPERLPGENGGPGHGGHGNHLDLKTWWYRWANTESMHRVVYAAFMMDILNAAMFGHNADMQPHEIQLPLPCNDVLWGASSPEHVKSAESSLRMVGATDVNFLDGLKNALHGKDVKTHPFGRMIILSGLLSVGWHLRHRETQLKWLGLRDERIRPQDNWRTLLLTSFDNWKEYFDFANVDQALEQKGCSNGPVQSAAVLYHLAHISLHVSIIDCQVYARAPRLLGRKTSAQTSQNATRRMTHWCKLPSTRHAILHAFKLLHKVLGGHSPKPRSDLIALAQAASGDTSTSTYYSCRNETDPHRPWIMYYAALSIWAFIKAQMAGHGRLSSPRQSLGPARSYEGATRYLNHVACRNELDDQMAHSLLDGLPDLLDALRFTFGEARSEILREAHTRLQVCRDMITGQIQ